MKSGASKLIIGICGLLVIAIAVIAFIPSILSSSWGRDRIVSRLNQKLPFEISLQSVSLSWSGPQMVTGVQLSDPKSHSTFACDAVETDASLWDLMFGKVDLSNTAVQPYLPPNFALPMMGSLQLKNGRAEIRDAAGQALQLQNLELQVTTPRDASPITLVLSGQTMQRANPGSFDAKADIGATDVTFEAELVHFPLSEIDDLVGLHYPHLKGQILQLIGPSLELELKGKASPQNFELALKADAAQLHASLETVTQNHTIALKNPAQITLTMTPASLPDLPGVKLTQNAQVRLTLTQAVLPMTDKGIDFSAAAFQMNLDSSPLQLTVKGLQEPVQLKAFKASASSQKLSDALAFQVSATMANATLAADGNLKNMLSGDLGGNFNLTAKQFPIALLDQILGQNGKLTLALGPTLNAFVSARSGTEGSGGKIQIDTPQLKLPETTFKWDSQLSLTKPTALDYTPPAALLKGGPIHVDIASLSTPLSAPTQMNLSAQVTAPLLDFDNGFVLRNFLCKADVATLDKIHLAIQTNGIKAAFDSALKDNFKTLKILSPIDIDYLLDNQQFQKLLPLQEYKPVLTTPAALKFHLDPFTLPLSDIQMNKLSVKGTGSAAQLALSAPDQKKQMFLENCAIQFQADGAKGSANFLISGQAREDNSQPGTFETAVSLDKLFFTENGPDTGKIIFDIKANVQNLSMSVLETWLGKPQQLSAAFGAVLNAKLQAHSDPLIQQASITATSQFINIDCALALKDGVIQLQNKNQPAGVHFIVTQQGYAFLDQLVAGKNGARPYQLTQPGVFSISLSYLNWPVPPMPQATSLASRIPTLKADFAALKIQGDFHLDKLALMDRTSGQNVELNNLALNWSKLGSGEPVTFDLNATSGQGTISGKGQLDHLFSEKGDFDFSNLATEINLKVQQFPVIFLDFLARTVGKINAPFTTLFGETLSATASAQIQNMSGPININVNAPNTRIAFMGHLNQGILILNEPLHAQMNLTPQIGALLLKEVNPLSLKSMSARNPFTLEIAAAGFSLPVYPFDAAKVFIPNGRIELGQVVCQNEGNINLALGILKSRQLTKEKELRLWFAPIDFHINRGIADIERTEILISDTFDIAIWGQYDMVKDYVDMVLGLTAPCLRQAFGIKNLPENYVLQIPMKGPSDNVKLNTGKATAKIAALLAWQQKGIAGSLGGGVPGAVLGEFLGALGALPDADSKAPPPKHPFPWESAAPPKTKKELSRAEKYKNSEKYKRKKPSNKKNAVKRGDKPLKQLFKIFH